MKKNLFILVMFFLIFLIGHYYPLQAQVFVPGGVVNSDSSFVVAVGGNDNVTLSVDSLTNRSVLSLKTNIWLNNPISIVSGNYTLQSANQNHYSIHRPQEMSTVISIAQNASLSIGNSDTVVRGTISLDGDSSISSLFGQSSSIFVVNGTLNLYQGSRILNFVNTAYGINNFGIVNIYGGEILNTTTTKGGFFYNNPAAILNIGGGTANHIEGNAAYCSANSTLNLSGNIQYGNNAVALAPSAIVTLKTSLTNADPIHLIPSIITSCLPVAQSFDTLHPLTTDYLQKIELVDSTHHYQLGLSSDSLKLIIQTIPDTIKVVNCHSYYWPVSDSTYTQSTIHTLHNLSVNGCDSSVTLNLTIIPTNLSLRKAGSSCYGDSVLLIAESSMPNLFWVDMAQDTVCYNDTLVIPDTMPIGSYQFVVTAYQNYTYQDSLLLSCSVVDTLSFSITTQSNDTLDIVLCQDKLPYHFGDSSITAAGYYTQHFITANGCDSIVTIHLTVNPSPAVPIIKGNHFFCAGSNTVLSVDTVPNIMMIWNAADTAQQIVCSSNGVITVQAVDTLGCRATSTPIYISSKQLPSYTLRGDSVICAGDTSLVEVVPNNTQIHLQYTWSSGDTTQSITCSDSSNLYFVTVTNEWGCQTVDSFMITVNPLPTLTLVGTNAICEYDYSTIVASANDHYYWSTGDTTSSIRVNVEGNYYVTVTNNNQCSTVDSFMLYVHSQPDVVITGEEEICLNNSVTLTAFGGTEYRWSTGALTAQIVDTPTVTTIYYVTVSNEFTCVTVDSFTVVVNPNPIAMLSEGGEICEGDTAILTASGGASYSWNTGSTQSSLAITQTGEYVVTITNIYGCSMVKSANVLVNDIPEVMINGEDFFCTGNAVTLTASGGDSYIWNTGNTNSSLTIYQPGNYSVTATNIAGCTATASKTISEISLPIASITGDSVICAEGDAVLIVSSGSSYSWNNGSTEDRIVVSPVQSTVYTVTVYNSHGCSASDNIRVIVNPRPQFNISGNSTFCQRDSTLLTASGVYSYVWSNNSTDASIYVSKSGLYSVTATNQYGCTDSESITVNVIQTPSISINGRTAFCQGSNTTLTAMGAINYYWNSGEATATIVTGNIGSYTVTGTASNGCSSTATVVVTTSPMPNAAINGNRSFCDGENTNLTATGGNSYRWNDGTTSNSIIVTNPGIYSVTVTNEYGCTSSISASVTTLSLPTPSISGNTTICEGSTAVLTASGGVRYDWSTGVSTANISVNTTGTYSVTVTNNRGCEAETSTTVIVNPLPVITIIGNNDLCIGSSTTLYASSASGNSYTWTSGQTTPFINVTPSSTTNYMVLVTDANNCSKTSSITVTVNPMPTPSIIANPIMCQGEVRPFTATGGTSFLWSTGESSSVIQVSNPGNYGVTVSNSSGCSASTSLTAIVNALPVPNITGTTSICQGETAQLTGAGGVSYSWSNGSSSPTIYPTVAGNYYVTVTNQAACTATTSATLVVNALPSVSITGQMNICSGTTTVLTANGNGLTGYLWSTGATTSNIQVSSAGTYIVTVSNANGCTSTASATVTVNSLPNIAISGDISLCPNQSTTLSVGEAQSYLWSTGETSRSIVVQPSENTVYSVTVTNQNGCYASALTTVTINQSPTVTITGTTAFCNGDSTLITASGANSYLWSNGKRSAAFMVKNSGLYIVTATDNNGCTSTASTNISLYALPIISINGNNIICEGESTTFTSFSNQEVSYHWNANQNTAAITVSNAGLYAVTATNSNGCSATASKTLTVNPRPTPVISGVTSVCPGFATTLTVNGGSSFEWSTGNVNNSIIVNPMVSTSYSVVSTNQYGCTASTSTMVNTYSLPIVSISGTRQFCSGGSTVLTAVGSDNYSWSTGSVTPAAIITNPGIYVVTATNIFGCTSTSSAQVSTLALPEVTISGNTAICSGETTLWTAQANSISSFLWSTGDTTASIQLTDAGNYAVTVTNQNGCIHSVSSTLIVNSRPTPTISGTLSVCPGNSTTLTGEGANSYLWSNGSTENSIQVTPSTTTHYYVTATNQQGCTATTSATILMNPVPSLTINGVNTICMGNNSVLEVQGANQYVWSNNAITPSITVSSSGIYSVTGTNNFGCTSTASSQVTVLSLPEVNIQGNLSICQGSNTTLSVTAVPGASYFWSNESTNSSIQVSTAGLYSLTITDANGCSSNASVVLNVNPLPSPSISGANTICPNRSTQLVAHGGNSYMWSNGVSSDTIVVAPMVATNYIVTATNAAGCTATSSLLVTINISPSISISGNSSYCDGSSTTLTAMNGASYQWSNGLITPTIVVDNPGTYSVTGTNSLGCTNTATLVVIENPTPISTISGITTICSGNSTTLTANGGSNYYWSNGVVANNITVSPTTSATYYVTVTNDYGCTSTANAVVSINSLPTPSITGNNTICLGEITTFTATGGDSYLWSNSSSSSNIIVSTGGTYTVTATNSNGCTATASTVLTVNSLPSPSIIGSTTICDNDNAILSVSVGNSYLWSTGETANSITIEDGGSYSVTVTNSNNCTATASTVITTFPAPEIIITGNTNICLGNNTTLVANGANSYLWNTGSNNSSIFVQPEVTTDYTVTATNSLGCSTSTTVTVMINPVYNTPVSASICQGQPYNGNGFSLPAQNEAGTFTHSIILSSIYGCDSTVVLTLEVKPIPVFNSTISGLSLITVAGTYNYSIDDALYADVYEWSINQPNFTLNHNNSTFATLIVDCPGSAILTVTAINNCGTDSEQLPISSTIVGIDNFSSIDNIQVYPIPTTQLIFIELPAESVDAQVAQIFDLNGKLLKTELLTGFSTTISLVDLSNGYYFLRLLNSNGEIVSSKKLIKQ